ncbi:hypothetical protein [Nocardia exalbida]|uniref:hypothetical protein n=1 Tax=Nocardia exalbida TaxID=290231 RepID=UPI0003160F93|nr:hypothetical protein [Nocardia exalbida]
MRRLERAGLLAAAVATAAGVLLIGACAQQVSGTAEVNRTDLAAYASEVTSSSAAASSSRAAAVERATGSACDAFLAANGSSVRAFNDYIDASNAKGRGDPDTNSKADTAVSTLRNNARSVDQKVTREVPSVVADPLRAYRDDTNALADTLARRADTDTLNAVIDRFNATKNTALTACQGHGTR